MARLTPTFRAESERIHGDHLAMIEVLTELERELDHLANPQDDSHASTSIGAVREHAWRMIRELPEHCSREEAQLLGPVSDVSPQLAEFCRQMKQEHQVMLAHLPTFRAALEELENSRDREAAIRRVTREGKELTREIRRHVEVEEQELSGFL